MAWVPPKDYFRILEDGMAIERAKIEREKKREKEREERKQKRKTHNRVLERRDRVDYNLTILLCIASVIIILVGLLRLSHELAWWLST